MLPHLPNWVNAKARDLRSVLVLLCKTMSTTSRSHSTNFEVLKLFIGHSDATAMLSSLKSSRRYVVLCFSR